jgi:hypothetical protein
MARKQFTFYESFFSALSRIKKAADRAAAYDSLCAYALYGTEPDFEALPDAAAIAFDLIKPTLDASRRKSESGKQGGSKTQANSKQTASKVEANCKLEETSSEKENEKEGEKEVENECSLPPTPLSGERRAFTPPSVGEVGQYCEERCNGIDPQAFVDFYAPKGWMIGKNKMKDWKAAVRTWERDPRRVQEQQNKFGGDRLLEMLRTGVFDDE